MESGKSASEVSIRDLLRSLSVGQAWSLLLAVAGVLATTFVLGTKVAAYRLDRLQDKVATLEEELEGRRPHQAEQATAQRPSDLEGTNHLESSAPLTPSTPVAYQHIKFSTRQRPFPEGFDAVVPGRPLSEATRAHPGGDLDSLAYSVTIPTGAFSYVGFRYGYSPTPDPTVEGVYFFFRDPSFREKVLSDALAQFGALPHRSESLGLRTVWPAINGFELAINEAAYTIRKSSAGPPP